jgi:hypothetical protein
MTLAISACGSKTCRRDQRPTYGSSGTVAESFLLEETEKGTRLTWEGEMGTDFGRWGGRVAGQWERAVRRSITAVTPRPSAELPDARGLAEDPPMDAAVSYRLAIAT